MPKLSIFNALSCRGVDMQTNPLLIGPTKLHAATNMLLDEGVFRTRYDFDFIPLGPEGHFQGAASYNPSKGLSYAPLSSAASGLLTVIDGAVFFNPVNNCTADRISRQVFCGHGDVNVFQAENYIVFQNLNTSTFWWNGEGDIVESPGNIEEEWSDRNMPETVIEPVTPVAEIPDCVVVLPVVPFNIHSFLTLPDGSYPLDDFFNRRIVANGNAAITKWRLHTDACGDQIEYFVGDLSDTGRLLVTGTRRAGSSGFNSDTKDFDSTYPYPEGVFLQLGVIIDGVLTWPELTPCVAGGSTDEDFD